MPNWTEVAARSLAGKMLSFEEARQVLYGNPDELLDLLSAAFRVRLRHFGRRVQLHVLMNAKSGLCPEDCGYCSQSAVSVAEIERYPLAAIDRLVSGAQAAKSARARRFCVVISARGPSPRELEKICAAARAIKSRVEIELCCSLGLLREDDVAALKAAGVDRINHNLNTSRRFYPEICSTHTYQDRVDTIRRVQAASLMACCGVIVGMGEADEDLYEMALALRELRVDSVPVNFLHPIEGTPLAGTHLLTPQRCLRILCLFRFLLPDLELRISGGREFHLRSLQPLALYPANSLFVGGYLTTPGQGKEEVWRMLEDLGFEIEEAPSAARR